MRKRWLGLVALGLLAGACGGGSGSGDPELNVIKGTVMGSPVVTEAAIAGFGLRAAATTREVLLSSVPAICDNVRDREFPPDAQHLVIRFFKGTENDTLPADSPGEYEIISDEHEAPGNYAVVMFNAWVNERTTAILIGTAGSVNITAISAQRIEGSVDVTLMNGDKLQARFDAKQCDALVCPLPSGNNLPCF